jgi:hypothetical protein
MTTMKLTQVQIRELKSIKNTNSFDKCTARTFNSLCLNGLICSVQLNGESRIGLTDKALTLLHNK